MPSSDEGRFYDHVPVGIDISVPAVVALPEGSLAVGKSGHFPAFQRLERFARSVDQRIQAVIELHPSPCSPQNWLHLHKSQV